MPSRTLPSPTILLCGIALAALAASASAMPTAPGALAARQAATPTAGGPTAGATIADRAGAIIGTASFAEGEDGRVTVTVAVLAGLAPGDHGIHLHETGSCDPGGDQPFASAGAHLNPTNLPHPEHAGDLGNLTAMANGSAELQVTTDRFTLAAGPTSLDDEDGTALLIHEGADDLQTDPSGNSGSRLACGVVVLGQGTAPAATPAVPAAASPAAPGGVPTAEASPAA